MFGNGFKIGKRQMVKQKATEALTFSQTCALEVIVFIGKRAVTFQKRLVNGLKTLQKALSQETRESKEMLAIYQKSLQGQATRAEMKKANRQLRDIFKGLGIGVIVVLPFSPITLPLLVGLGRKFGIEILPTAFQTQNQTEQEENTRLPPN